MDDAGFQSEQSQLGKDTVSTVAVDALGMLLRASPEDLDHAIDSVLQRLATNTQADRAYLFLETDGTWSNSHEWCAPGIASAKADLQDVPADLVFPALDHSTCEDAGVAVPLDIADVETMPNGPLRDMLRDQGIRSILEMPMMRDTTIRGMVGLERINTTRGFTDQDRWLLDRLSDGLTSSLARRAAERDLATVSTQQRQTLERLRATLAAMPELLLEIDEAGRCIEYHCSEPDLLADSPERILGHTLEETLPADIAALQRRGMEQARRHGTASVPSYAIGTAEARRWYSLTIARRTGCNGPDGYVFRIRDITDDHERDRENALLIQVTRRMTNLAFVLNPDLTIRWANPALEERTGYKLSDMAGRSALDFVDKTADPAATAKLMKAFASRSKCHVEVCKVDCNGVPYCVDVDAQPLISADGNFEGFLMIETDITLRKQHERDLEALAAEASASRQRLQDAIAAIPDGFSYFDADDRLLMCNDKYRDLVPSIADVIQPGVKFEDILDTAISRGEFAHALGQEDAWREKRLALHQDASGELEIRLNDGRWLHSYERKTPDGGRVGMRIDITALKRAEQRMNDIIDAARIGTWEYDSVTSKTSVNALWGKMLGGRDVPVELNGESWNKHLHPHDLERANAAMQALLSGELQSFEEEYRLRHSHGHWVHILCRGQVTARDANGNATKISGIGLDLTERRRAEDRLRAILGSSSIGTWQIVTETGLMIIDDAYAAMLGYTLEELQPLTMERAESLIHPDDVVAMRNRIAGADPASHDVIEHEFRARHREGHWVWILSQARVERWLAPGVPAEESGVHIDISERKKREAALARTTRALEEALAAQQASEQRYSDIAEVSDDWFWEIGPDNHIVHLTSGFERLTGWPVTNLQGRALMEVGFARESKFVQGDWDRLSQCVKNLQPLADFLFRVTVKHDDHPVWVRVSGAPFTDAAGNHAGYRGVGSSVNELIASTERAEAASRAKSQFLANMSHELRTPLTGVLGMADLLSETVVSDKQRAMIETIRDSGEGLLTILNDILDLAKIEAGKMTIDSIAFAPADTLERVRALFQPRAKTDGIALVFQSDAPSQKRWLADGNRVQQILNNLIGNAVKFTPSGSVTTTSQIKHTPDGDMLVIRVTDTGIGMTRDQVNKVFDEFEQAEGSTARRFGGTGLGLSITQRLVRLMGGEITLTSQLGLGTEVTVRLPVTKAPDHHDTPPEPSTPTRADLSGKRVLVADDNATNRKILETMLSALGLTVTLACDGHDACRLYELGNFDLLMLDISMPGLDGIGALSAIRHFEENSHRAHIPALAVTANAMQHQVEEYLAAGFAGHVAKPFRKATLANSVSLHLTPVA